MNQKKNKTSEYRLNKGVFFKMKNRFSDLKAKLDQEFKVKFSEETVSRNKEISMYVY
jgi:hypothetical protein